MHKGKGKGQLQQCLHE